MGFGMLHRRCSRRRSARPRCRSPAFTGLVALTATFYVSIWFGFVDTFEITSPVAFRTVTADNDAAGVLIPSEEGKNTPRMGPQSRLAPACPATRTARMKTPKTIDKLNALAHSHGPLPTGRGLSPASSP